MQVFWAIPVLIGLCLIGCVGAYIREVWAKRPNKPKFIDEARDATFATVLASLEEHPEQWQFGSGYLNDKGVRVLEANDKREWLYNYQTGICIYVERLVTYGNRDIAIQLSGTREVIAVPLRWQTKIGAKIVAMANTLKEKAEVEELREIVERFKKGTAK